MKRFPLLVLTLLTLAASAYSQFQFTSLDYPGGALTTARGITKQGVIVGGYFISAPPRHALLIQAGQYIPLAPNTILGTNRSEAFGINNLGDVVGSYTDNNGFDHGFLLSNGVLTTLDFPGASDTDAFGINKAGTVVGEWDLLDSNGNVLVVHGFSWKNGTFTQFDFPGAGYTYLININDHGDLVGGWDTGVTSPNEHGFVCSKKQCSSFDAPVPGATTTQGDDISAKGHIVGTYVDSSGILHGFLVVGSNFTSLDFPGAAGTVGWGINATGRIVGRYVNADGSIHGFLATPE